MPRRKAAIKREVLPDPLYSSEQVAKFINVIMRKGKKSIAEKIVYTAIQSLAEKVLKDSKHSADSNPNQSDEGSSGDSEGGASGSASSGKTKSSKVKSSKPSKSQELNIEECLGVLQKSLSNIVPTVEVKSRRVGGATYQVPIDVAYDRGVALAMRWIVQASKGRGEKTMALRLSAELYEAYMGRGTAVKMRDDVHKMAKANQAFAHYRW